MSRREDLENDIRASYRIIRDYRRVIQTSEQPEERLRAKRQIENQWDHVKEDLQEYNLLVRDGFPRDIAEIAAHFEDLRQSAWLSQKEPLRPEVRAFLDRSDLSLKAIGSAILTFICPSTTTDWGWHSDQEVIFTYDPMPIERTLPAEMLEISRDYRTQNPGKRDSVKYCVTNLCAETRDAGGRLLLTAQSVHYLTAYPIGCALQQSSQTPAGDPLRDLWYSKLESRTTPLTPNILGAHVLAVTGDKKLILLRRRADKELDFYRGYWSATFEEQFNAPWEGHLQKEEVYPQSITVDSSLFQGLKRGLGEELKLTGTEIAHTTLRALAVGFEYENFNTAVFAVSELPRSLTSEKLVDRLLSSEECDRVAFCEFTISALQPALTHATPPNTLCGVGADAIEQWKWHPTSLVRILLALRREYGEAEVRSWLEQE